jgi:hypothetical protein
MPRKRPPTADDIHDRRYRRLPNDPGAESRDLSQEEAVIFDNARNAADAIKKTFENWIVIGRAVVAARARADRLGGGKTFRRILKQQGLDAVVPPATASRLLLICGPRLSEVQAWHNRLKPHQQFAWAGPRSVINNARDASGQLIFPKKKKDGGQSQPPAPTKKKKRNVEVAIDALVDILQDEDADNRRAILERVLSPFGLRLAGETARKRKPTRIADPAAQIVKGLDTVWDKMAAKIESAEQSAEARKREAAEAERQARGAKLVWKIIGGRPTARTSEGYCYQIEPTEDGKKYSVSFSETRGGIEFGGFSVGADPYATVALAKAAAQASYDKRRPF